jgi:hypothetical protein
MKICIVYAHDELISDTKNLCAELVNRYDAQVRFFPSILKSELDDLSGYDAVILLYNPRDLPDLEDFIDEIKAQVRAGSVCLNNRGAGFKWISALVMPQPGLAATH